MALKYKITKKAHGLLSEELQTEYKLVDDSYVLDVAGLPEPEDNGELKRAKDREKQRADDATEELTTVKNELKTIKAGQTDGDRDVAALTKRHERALVKKDEEHAAKLETRDNFIRKSLIDTTAMSIATEVSTVPKIFAEHVAKHLTVEFPDDGDPVLKVMTDGKSSDKKVDDLKKELLANKDFAGILVGSKAKGGGTTPAANPLNPGGAGTEKPTDLTKASTADLTSVVRARVEARHAAAGTNQ